MLQADVNTLWEHPQRFFRLPRLLLDLFAQDCNLKNAIAENSFYHRQFLQELVLTLYGMKAEETIDNHVDFLFRAYLTRSRMSRT